MNDSPSTLYESLQLVIGPRALLNSTNENKPNNSIVKSMKYSSSLVTGSLPTAKSVSQSVYRPEYSYSNDCSSSSSLISSSPSQPIVAISSPSIPPQFQPHLPVLTPSTPPIMTHIITSSVIPQQQIMPNFIQFPIHSGNLVLDPRNPVVNVRLPEDASSIREDGTFQDTQAITVAPLPLLERNSIPSSFDHPDFSSQEFRSLLQPSHPILNQLRKHAMSSKFTMSSRSQQVMDNPDRAVNFTRVSQTNGPGELMTGSLVFGCEEVSNTQNNQHLSSNQESVNLYGQSMYSSTLPVSQQKFHPQILETVKQDSYFVPSVNQAPSSLLQDQSTSLEQPSRFGASPPLDATSQSLAFLEEFARNYSVTTGERPPESSEENNDFTPSDLFLFNNNRTHDNNNTSSDLSSHEANIQFDTPFDSQPLNSEDSIDSRSWCKKPRLEMPEESPKQTTDSSS